MTDRRSEVRTAILPQHSARYANASRGKKSDITRSAGEGGLSIDCQITIKGVSKQYIMIDGISNAVPWTEQRQDSFRTPISLMIVNVKQSDLSAVCLQ